MEARPQQRDQNRPPINQHERPGRCAIRLAEEEPGRLVAPPIWSKEAVAHRSRRSSAEANLNLPESLLLQSIWTRPLRWSGFSGQVPSLTSEAGTAPERGSPPSAQPSPQELSKRLPHHPEHFASAVS